MAQTEISPLLRKPAQYEAENGPASSSKKTSGARNVLGIILALIGVYVAGADQFFIIATYEEIASDVNGLSKAPWLLTGYNLGYCVALPVYGKFSDIYGRKLPLITGYSLFSAGCLMSGLGLTIWPVVLGRVISGIGAASMTSMVSVVIADNVPSSQVALMRSFVSIASALGRVSGGPLGAFIMAAVGWKWSFIAQAPLIIGCGISSLILMPDGRPAKGDDSEGGSSRSREIDYIGTITLTIAITAFLIAMTPSSQGSTDNSTFHLCIGLACVSASLFFVIELFHAKNPLIPFTSLGFTINISLLIQIVLYIAHSALLTNQAPYFVRVEGMSSTGTAKYLLSFPIGFTSGSIIGGLIIKKTHRLKKQSIISLVASVIIYMLIGIQWKRGENILEIVYMALAGFAFGPLLTGTFTALSAAAPRHLSATAITSYYVCQQIGSMIGTSLSAAVLQRLFKSALATVLQGEPARDQIIKGVLEDINFPETLPVALQELVRASFLQSFQVVAYLITGVTALTLPLLLACPEQVLD